MSTTTKERKEEPVSPLGIDYFLLETRSSSWMISTVMVRHVESRLDLEPRPAWIVFVDLAGARVRIRSQDVESLSQSTSEQRSKYRAFCRGFNREKTADRDWAEDE